MPVIITSQNFVNLDQMTSTKLNSIVGGTSFTSTAATTTNDGTLLVIGGLLQLGTVTSSNMGVGSVNSSAIVDGSITGTDIAALTIGGGNIAALAIDFTKMATSLTSTISQVKAETSGSYLSPNTLKFAPSSVQCRGTLVANGGTAVTLKTGSYGIASMTFIDASTTLVTMSAAMADVNYQVVCTANTNTTPGSGFPYTVAIFGKTTTTFYIYGQMLLGLSWDFTVHGVLA